MYQNAIYICIDKENCLFSVKQGWCQQKQGVYHKIHIFLGSSLGKV